MFHRQISVLLLFHVLSTSAQFFPPGWFDYQNARWSECQNYYSTCAPTISACARGLCAQCYNFGGAGFKSCCNQPTPYLCFQTAKAGAGAITTAPPPVTDAHQLACQSAVSIVTSCESATSNFDNLDDSVVASCLCYSGTSWQPQSFDQPWSSCIAFASTGDTSDYAGWSSLAGFCSSVGDVIHGPASATARTTAATTATAVSTPTTTGQTAVVSFSTTGSSTVVATTAAPTRSGADQLDLNSVFLKYFAIAAVCITAQSLIYW